jgi:nucleolar protein 6
MKADSVLFTQKDRVEQGSFDSNQNTFPSMPDKPQRYSKTSGLEQKPMLKRTWTVEDEVDDGKTRRGGKKHAKGSKTRAKDWGTGVNAIPVG